MAREVYELEHGGPPPGGWPKEEPPGNLFILVVGLLMVGLYWLFMGALFMGAIWLCILVGWLFGL